MFVFVAVSNKNVLLTDSTCTDSGFYFATFEKAKPFSEMHPPKHITVHSSTN